MSEYTYHFKIKNSDQSRTFKKLDAAIGAAQADIIAARALPISIKDEAGNVLKVLSEIESDMRKHLPHANMLVARASVAAAESRKKPIRRTGPSDDLEKLKKDK